jgi:hypothetical protein
VEVPVAYWGQEYKPCPVCSAQILAAALRCRKCGTIFKTARPLESDEFSKAVSQEASAPRLRRSIVWLFILCVVPFTAPVAGVVALLWRHSRQEDIRRLSSIYSALALIAVVVGLFQTVAIVVLGALFTLFRA